MMSQEEEFEKIVGLVTERMLKHVRPFGTPLGTSTEDLVRLVGSGAYVKRKNHIILLTCEHVARNQPIHIRFNGSNKIYEQMNPWIVNKHPVDVAFSEISAMWDVCFSQADTIPFERFAISHNLVHVDELLFFRGYAGENAHYAFGVHQTNGSGYCTQEKKEAGDEQLFELFWEPQLTRLTPGTSDEVRAEMKFEDPSGFSGSLVWNTRYFEVTRAGQIWSPQDAIVTGLLRRWDPKTKTLLVWRIEHLREWLDKMAPV